VNFLSPVLVFMLIQIMSNSGKWFVEIKWPVKALCKYWLRMPEDNHKNRIQDRSVRNGYSNPRPFDWEAVMWTITPTSVSASHNVLLSLLFLFAVYIARVIGAVYIVAGTVIWVVFLPCTITDIQLITSPGHLYRSLYATLKLIVPSFCEISHKEVAFKTVHLASKWHRINRPLITKVFWRITFQTLPNFARNLVINDRCKTSNYASFKLH
jgi:hypothetical protein